MKIVHVITRGDVGGAQTQMVELAAEQRRDGHHVTIVTGIDGPAMHAARRHDVAVTVIPALAPAGTSARSRRWGKGALPTLRRTLSELQPDVVHGHSSSAGLLARLAARQARLPSVYTAHGWPFQAGAGWRQRILSWCGEFIGGHVGDAVICLTPAEAALARRARVASPARIWIVPNGISDVGRVAPSLSRSHDSVGVIMVARFAPPKRQDELVRVMARMTDLDWRLELVGDGPLLDGARRAACPIADRVVFTGHSDDVVERLAASDVFVLWSRYEGMPISLLEAMRAGLCCVASDLAGVRELLGDPPAGLLARDLAGLESALRSSIGDPALRGRLGAQARARFEMEFSVRAVWSATRRVYDSVVRR